MACHQPGNRHSLFTLVVTSKCEIPVSQQRMGARTSPQIFLPFIMQIQVDEHCTKFQNRSTKQMIRTTGARILRKIAVRYDFSPVFLPSRKESSVGERAGGQEISRFIHQINGGGFIRHGHVNVLPKISRERASCCNSSTISWYARPGEITCQSSWKNGEFPLGHMQPHAIRARTSSPPVRMISARTCSIFSQTLVPIFYDGLVQLRLNLLTHFGEMPRSVADGGFRVPWRDR